MSKGKASKVRPSGEGDFIRTVDTEGADVDSPILASFPDFPTKPSTLNFVNYARTKDDESGGAKRRRIVVGETSSIEYVASNAGQHNFCRYVVGVYDKKSQQLSLQEAEVFRVDTIVKSLKHHVSRHVGEKNTLARNTLGEAFGTRKRRQAIKALEKNEVDVAGLAEVEDAIKETIDEKSMGLPTREEVMKEAQNDRSIPPYNMNATSPSEVYNPDDLISPLDLNALNIKELVKARNTETVQKLIKPITTSKWITERICQVLKAKNDTVTIRRLVYLAYLMKFHNLKINDLNSDNLSARLGGVPQVICESLILKFTEYQEDEGRKRYRMTPKLTDLLRAYILAICLTVDGFKVNSTEIARDLKIPAKQMHDIARELGCRFQTYTTDDDKTKKIMGLSVPLSFPQRTR
ncbi:RNA polymerase I associated factor, A49-like protein [Phlyctochytrium arcticum]|nr:RNA polymerase I associated factor, A49-like protein [Phlyctochytrium arcticum]